MEQFITPILLTLQCNNNKSHDYSPSLIVKNTILDENKRQAPSYLQLLYMGNIVIYGRGNILLHLFLDP